ncbi:hypothetical protein NQ315_000411 [Exocentrus adspersus]|uniref:Ubiquitin-like protease family profile domain-containing protein n=1 Tax=Exocentrus adspersus TaxID=1586481 RepID=A0AAV8VM00_9CUCU|nr:hypothetical protein NQ315_000411 [Exocentrus adspersus]
MSNNLTVLSYNESLLRESDVELLRGPYWLNDTVISFYFEFLQTDLFKAAPFLLFVSPEVTQCIKMCPQSECSIFLDPLVQTVRRDFIFFALNDNEMIDASGGSHWSLLVFSRPEKMMFHYDSSNGCNDNQAVELSYKILRYLSLPQQGAFQNLPCLQQSNGYDCGIHVLCNAEQLARYACRYARIRDCPKITYNEVAQKRLEILEIIEKLKKKYR